MGSSASEGRKGPHAHHTRSGSKHSHNHEL
jgi:hypothetical protein